MTDRITGFGHRTANSLLKPIFLPMVKNHLKPIVEPMRRTILIHMFTHIYALITTKMYELTCFDGKGRAEAIRLMLHAPGTDWKGTRFSFNN